MDGRILRARRPNFDPAARPLATGVFLKAGSEELKRFSVRCSGSTKRCDCQEVDDPFAGAGGSLPCTLQRPEKRSK